MRRIIKWSVIGLIGIATILGILMYFNVIWINLPLLFRYPVKGVDVSHYQGEIDWQVLSKNNISFAIIKATEGSSHQDECFTYNYEEASKTNLYVGAYHFFSFDSSGVSQAENYMSIVPISANALPPIIDFEFYGDKQQNPPSKEEVYHELNDLITSLEEHYGKKPIIYATQSAYKQYLEGNYDTYPIWIRNLLVEPREVKWTFWQYANWGKLQGYSGAEEHIDLNVFNGSKKEFQQFLEESKLGN